MVSASRPVVQIIYCEGINHPRINQCQDFAYLMSLGNLNLWAERGNESFQYFTKALYIAKKYGDEEGLAEASFMVAHLIRFGVSDLSLIDHLQTVIDIYENSEIPR